MARRSELPHEPGVCKSKPFATYLGKCPNGPFDLLEDPDEMANPWNGAAHSGVGRRLIERLAET